MKASEIILQLKYFLPKETDYFSNKLQITAIAVGVGTATFTTASAHGYTVGSLASIFGVMTPCMIDSVATIGSTYEISTLTDHDLTYNTNTDIGDTVRLTCPTNNTDAHFTLLSVANRRNFVVNSTPVSGADNGFSPGCAVQQPCLIGYNGLKTITVVPTTTTFTVATDFDLPVPTDYVGAFVTGAVRVSGAISPEVMIESYTKQVADKLWAFVVLGDFVPSKDRFTPNDAYSQQGRQGDFRQDVVEAFSIFVIVPNKGTAFTDTNGRSARDMIETIRRPLFRSVLGLDLSADLSASGQGSVTYGGDRAYSYSGAYYVHEFKFQQVIQITGGDTAIEVFERAFRDIALIQTNQFDELSPYTADINLDDEPL